MFLYYSAQITKFLVLYYSPLASSILPLPPDTSGLCRLISFTNFNAKFLSSLTVCMLYYNPRHVSRINMPIFRRSNCIITASGIITLCKGLYSMPDESRLQSSALKLVNEISLYYDARLKKHLKKILFSNTLVLWCQKIRTGSS